MTTPVQRQSIAPAIPENRSIDTVSNRVNDRILQGLQAHFKGLLPHYVEYLAARKSYRIKAVGFGSLSSTVKALPGCLPGFIICCFFPQSCPTVAFALATDLIGCTCCICTVNHWSPKIAALEERGLANPRHTFIQARMKFDAELGGQIFDIPPCTGTDHRIMQLIEHLGGCSFCCEAVTESLYTGTVAWNRIVKNLTQEIQRGKSGAILARVSGLTAFALENNQMRINDIALINFNLDRIAKEVSDLRLLPTDLNRICVSYLGCALEPGVTGRFREDMRVHIGALFRERPEDYVALCRGLVQQEPSDKEEADQEGEQLQEGEKLLNGSFVDSSGDI